MGESVQLRAAVVIGLWLFGALNAAPAAINAMPLPKADAVSSATPISSPEAQAPPLANPLPAQETEGVSSTTTDNYAQIALAYTSKPSTLERLHYSAGVHKFFVGPHEDTVKRTLEEYHDKFERFEQNALRTTPRYNRKPPSVY
ncbi:uncharacterized protein LOC128275542 isoform X2 [Anopheles cruzii]|uniref:uncharacterized protein LOC128275542 isoform X2 n=1 Tax=Anopheles cruzii TaxID=68878 RepID=UPI0022EC26C1|nr:uncharacterized protein LOC128275542 isoform X2 [Anopheles cruzii]